MVFSIWNKPKARVAAPPSPTLPLPRPVNLHSTLWPAFPHFSRFASDQRLAGLRLNSAMMAASEIDIDFIDKRKAATVPLWFDIKGMQLRIREVVCDHTCDHLEFIVNRPVRCKTPCTVYFKAGEDYARLLEIRDGKHFIFEKGPQYIVKEGESIHIKDPQLDVGGELLLDYEMEKIAKVQALGFNSWYLSYVFSQKHVDEFREVIGPDAQLILKIENKAGLEYASRFKATPNTHLMAARGDLFIEVDWPHQIMEACKLVIERDPEAFAGSRMLLSVVNQPVPSCADLCELAWLYDIGYRNFLLCDELCLKEPLLARAVNVFDAFRKSYCKDV